MYYKSKKITLLILAVTALVFSKILFSLFDDPEGPNLLVIGVGALIVWLVSLLAYAFRFAASPAKRIALAVVIQAVLVTGLYFGLR